MKTQLEILKPTDDNYKSVFQVIVNFMHGDADGDSQIDFFFNTKEEVLELINKLDALRDKHGYYDPSDDDAALGLDIIADWPYDMFSDGERYASYRGTEVFWYDENHVKHNVNVG